MGGHCIVVDPWFIVHGAPEDTPLIRTARGRTIPGSDTIPGFCYVIADLTSTVRHRCKVLGLRETSDKQGYFGFNDNFRAYIEVISFDRLLNAARERNRAFFDRLGLPTP